MVFGRLTLHDSTRALQRLAKLFGMFLQLGIQKDIVESVLADVLGPEREVSYQFAMAWRGKWLSLTSGAIK